jgi:hypothetical protein
MDPELAFSLLDDVLPQYVDSRCAEQMDQFTRARINSIGPLLEYVFQSRTSNGRLPSLDQLPLAEAVIELRGLFAVRCFSAVPLSSSHAARRAEFMWLPPDRASLNAPTWVMFLRRMQNAAEHAGFSKQVAKGLAGAFIEMADNVLGHSENAKSGIGGYRWEPGCFEYVVADAGIGVLASLRTCSDYADLTDAGTALQVALREGESRFGRAARRGGGFRQVLVSLADLSGSLRFRSGDHVLVIDGTSPELSQAYLHHLGIEYTGLLVSVACRPS